MDAAAPTPDTPAIAIRGLTKRFGALTALVGVPLFLVLMRRSQPAT